MSACFRVIARTGAIALGLATAAAALPITVKAAVISAAPDLGLATMPVTISFGAGAASYSFTAVSEAQTGIAPGAAVAIGGTALVSTLLGGITDFFAEATIDGSELYTFAAYPTATIIPNSPADDFIGLAFTLSDGLHYGYAEVDGASLVGYGYDSTPGATILTGATANVAEPATIALVMTGLVSVAATRRKRVRVHR